MQAGAQHFLRSLTMKLWPRTLLVALAGSLVVAACARANDPDGEAADDSADTSSTNNGDPSTGNGSPTGATTGVTNAATTGAGGATGGGGDMGEDGGGGLGDGGSGTTGGGGGIGSCAHDLCETGDVLVPGCDADGCVEAVCENDSYCCDTEWDDICVGEVADYCVNPVCAAPTPEPGDVIITEIMNNPTTPTDENGEWFELYNNSANDIDLMGMVIVHQANVSTAKHTIAQSVVFAPGEYAILGRNGDTSVNGNVAYDYVYGNLVSLANTDDYLAIELADGTLLDHVAYDEASGFDPNGASRNLDPNYYDYLSNDDDTRFCAATSAIPGGNGDKGTPGTDNDVCP